MKFSKTLLLFIVVVGLGGYIWFYELHQMSTREQKLLDQQAFDLPIEQIDFLGVRTRLYEVNLFKKDQGWELVHPKGARANYPIVQQVLARIKTLGRGEFITPADMRERELTLTDFGLAVPQLVLTLKTSGEIREYKVGDPNPLGNSVYVKEESSQNVMLVSSDLLDILPPEVAAFRDATLFPLNFSEVQSFDFISEERTLRMEKREGLWIFNDPIKALADQEKVSLLLNKLLPSRVEGVVNDPSEEELEAFNRSEHLVRIWNSSSKVPTEITIGGNVPGEPDSCYARIAGQEGLVLVSKGLRHLAQTPTFSLRDQRLFTEDPQAVTAIEIERLGQKIRLERMDLTWSVVEPVNLPASSARIQVMLKTWRDARVEAFIKEDETRISDSRVTFMAGADTLPVEFEVLEAGTKPGRALLRLKGQEGLLQVVPDLVRFSPVDVLPYLSRKVLNYDPAFVVRVSLTRGEDSFIVSREHTDLPWISIEEGLEINQDEIESILKAFSNLYAQTLVELNPKDLSTYGLDAPDIRLSIGLGGDQPANRTLLMSKNENDGFMNGIVQGQPLVFTLALPELPLLIPSSSPSSSLGN